MNFKKIKAMKMIKEEYDDLSKNNINTSYMTISVGLVNQDNIFEWKIAIIGPKDTSYKGGIFSVIIKFPENYPEKAPDVFFKTPVYHVNINPFKVNIKGVESLGHAYINILNDWKPETKMKDVFEHIHNLFFSVDLNSPYIFDKEEEIKYNRPVYEEKIKCFTKKYANPHKANLKYDIDWDFSSPEIGLKKIY